MIPLILHGFVLAPAAGAWSHSAVMTALAWRRQRAYDWGVPEKEGAWGESQKQEGARTAQCRFFTCVYAFVCSQWTAMAGEPQGSTVPSCRSLKPRHSLSTPFESVVGGSTAQEGGHHA